MKFSINFTSPIRLPFLVKQNTNAPSLFVRKQVLFQGLQDVLNSKIEFFKKLMTGQGLFKPTSHNSLQQLQNFRLKDLVMMHIHRYVGICQSGLDDLSLQKRELMNGVRKDKITAWWLHEIDTAVLSFLETLFVPFFPLLLYILTINRNFYFKKIKKSKKNQKKLKNTKLQK